MEGDTMEMYWEGITAIEAQQVLTALVIADYPHIKSSDRSRVYNDMKDKAYPHLREEEKTLTLEEWVKAQQNGQ